MRTAGLAALLLASAARAAPPERLILGLDGAAYHHVRAVQEGEGGRRCLAEFQPAARLISTYPSLSDVAWADVLGLPPQTAYQPLHFDYERNELRGLRGLQAMGDPTESSALMHWKLEGLLLNLGGYLFPGRVFRLELARVRSAFLRADGRDFYALLQTFDSAVHMGRDPRELLCETGAWIADLRRAHAARTGRALEVIVLSDHGTDDLSPSRAPIREHLRREGFRVVKRLQRRGDVVLPVDGILNVVQACPAPEDVAAVAAALVRLPEVDVVTAVVPGRVDEVRVLKRGEEAVVRARGGRYAYEAVRGDPLGYAAVAELLRRSGKADRDGFATGEAWLAATAGHAYPAAPERIVRGHGPLVRHPAPVIASLKPGRVSANLPTWLGSRLMSMGGTHGALDSLSSSGVALSTERRVPDTTTDRVRAYLGGFQKR